MTQHFFLYQDLGLLPPSGMSPDKVLSPIIPAMSWSVFDNLDSELPPSVEDIFFLCEKTHFYTKPLSFDLRYGSGDGIDHNNCLLLLGFFACPWHITAN